MKALSPIDVTEFPIVMLSKVVQSKKAFAAMVVTLDAISARGRQEAQSAQLSLFSTVVKSM